MKLVLTSDTHFSLKPEQIPDGDVLIHAGDLMYSGRIEEWNDRLESLHALPHRRKILVPGNHDKYIEQHLYLATTQLASAGVELLGIQDVYTTVDDFKLTVMGLPFVVNLPTWAFNRSEEWIKEYLLAQPYQAPDIVISHGPMFGIADDINHGYKPRNHVGCKAYRNWHNSLEVKPKLWVCGHIHEHAGITEHLGTKVVNASMCDRDYKQVHKPTVIDTNTWRRA